MIKKEKNPPHLIQIKNLLRDRCGPGIQLTLQLLGLGTAEGSDWLTSSLLEQKGKKGFLIHSFIPFFSHRSVTLWQILC
jgi:hypothetical protein